MSDSFIPPIPQRSLARELTVVVLVKLVVLAGLWWAFVKDQHVSVGTTETSLPWLADNPGAAPATDISTSPKRHTHDQ